MAKKREPIYEVVFIGPESQTNMIVYNINKKTEYGRDIEEYAKLRRKLGMPITNGMMPSSERIKQEIISLRKLRRRK